MPFRLGEADRKKFGLDDWIDFSTRRISVADLEELSERFDFEPTDWPDPYIGVLTLEQAGDPNAKAKPPRWRSRALVWMLLRQNGVDVSWDEAGAVAVYDMTYRDEAAVEVGKENGGSPPSTDSPTSAPSTTRRSRSSSTSPKRKSTS